MRSMFAHGSFADLMMTMSAWSIEFIDEAWASVHAFAAASAVKEKEAEDAAVDEGIDGAEERSTAAGLVNVESSEELRKIRGETDYVCFLFLLCAIRQAVSVVNSATV